MPRKKDPSKIIEKQTTQIEMLKEKLKTSKDQLKDAKENVKLKIKELEAVYREKVVKAKEVGYALGLAEADQKMKALQKSIDVVFADITKKGKRSVKSVKSKQSKEKTIRRGRPPKEIKAGGKKAKRRGRPPKEISETVGQPGESSVEVTEEVA